MLIIQSINLISAHIHKLHFFFARCLVSFQKTGSNSIFFSFEKTQTLYVYAPLFSFFLFVLQEQDYPRNLISFSHAPPPPKNLQNLSTPTRNASDNERAEKNLSHRTWISDGWDLSCPANIAPTPNLRTTAVPKYFSVPCFDCPKRTMPDCQTHARQLLAAPRR